VAKAGALREGRRRRGLREERGNGRGRWWWREGREREKNCGGGVV